MANLQMGPLSDDLASQSAEHENTVTTPGEVLGATATDVFNALPVPSIFRRQRRFDISGPDTQDRPAYDPRNDDSDVDAMAAERGDAPMRQNISADDANAQVKTAGAQGMTPFTQPTDARSVQSLIDDHMAKEQRADVIARNGSAILSGKVTQFALGALVSLADPLNDMAMMIPVVPEAFAAERLIAAGSALGRTAVRAGVGAAEGATGMAALEPLNYLASVSDHEDWSAGEALRNIAFGAALGAGGHAILGGLFGHLPPEAQAAALRVSLANVMHDVPVRDPAPVLTAAKLTAEADFLEQHAAPVAGGIVAYHGTPHAFDRFDIGQVGTGEGAQAFGHGLYFAEAEGVADSYRRQLTAIPEDALHDARSALARSKGDFDAAIADNRANWTDPNGRDAAQVEGILKHWQQHGASAEMPSPSGHLYQVRLNAEPHELLDWDKSLSAQPEVAARLRHLLGDEFDEAHIAGMSGAEAYQTVAALTRTGEHEETASADLHAAGVKGIRYLDRDSRAAGEGTHNIVMFNHDDVRITHKNGVPVADAIANLRAEAQGAARDMAQRAMNPVPDPAIAAATKENARVIASAPKLEGVGDKDLAEVNAMLAIHKAAYDTEVASGRMVEHPSIADAGKDIEDRGKAEASYAACIAPRM